MVANLLSVMPWAIAVVVLASVATCIARRWHPARRLARLATLAGLVTVAGSVAVLLFFWLSPAAAADVVPLFVGAGGDPSERALALAQFISILMNCSAFTLIITTPAVALWVWTARQEKRQDSQAA